MAGIEAQPKATVRVTRYAEKNSRRTDILTGTVVSIGGSATECGIGVQGSDGREYVVFLDREVCRAVSEFCQRAGVDEFRQVVASGLYPNRDSESRQNGD